MKYTLYIGLNDQTEKIQLIETEKAVKIVQDIFREKVDGSTVFMGNGNYTHDDGTRVNENTIIGLVFTDDENAVKEAAMEIKTVLNQEYIIIEKAVVDSLFI